MDSYIIEEQEHTWDPSIKDIAMPQYMVCLNSWAGISYVPVAVLERQPRRVKVRFLRATVGHATDSVGYPPYKAVGYWEGETWIPLKREETRRVGRRESSVACDGPAPGHYEEETSPQRRQRCRMAFGCVQSEGLSHGGSCRARAVASSAARTRA